MSDFEKPMDLIQTAKRLVVKVGTSVLTDSPQAQVERHCIESVASQIAALRREKKEVVVVTSGAIGVGMGILNLERRPTDLARLQAAAATGQGRLMQWYADHFEKEGFHVAQILLTRDDLENRKRYLNAKATLLTLLKAGVVPIINENDTVSVEEIRYGDNDILSAHVAALVDADLLVILSDVDQFRGPTGLQTVVTQVTPEMEKAARGTTRAISTGGMRTKLEAAKIALAGGIPMILGNGRKKDLLTKMMLEGEFFGTWFLPKKGFGLKGRQRWLGLTARPKGIVRVDDGAQRALVEQRRSLLASGITAVEGSFKRGDLVSVCDIARREFARGIVGYSHVELEKIRGLKSETASAKLGRKADEVIHRDKLVILRAS